MENKAAFLELNYQYKLLLFENDVLTDKFNEYLESLNTENNELPKAIIEGSKNYAKKKLSFLSKRKNILEYNLKNIEDELKRI